MKKKRNWIKGLDRIAILLAIPIALFGFSYGVNKYSKQKSIDVYYTEKDKLRAEKRYELLSEEEKEGKMIPRFQFIGGDDGIVANGKEELERLTVISDMLKFAIERAVKQGGDLNDTLISKKTFWKMNCDDDELCLIPRKFKRYAVGGGGALGFALITILSVGVTTRCVPRTVRWIKKGFKDA